MSIYETVMADWRSRRCPQYEEYHRHLYFLKRNADGWWELGYDDNVWLSGYEGLNEDWTIINHAAALYAIKLHFSFQEL